MNLSNLTYKLKLADEEDNINLLYEVIQDNPSILDIIDSKQFVETPLHIAASRGQIQFANEIMNLKPSFASKLNPQGFCPIHLAMQESKNRMVLCFVDMNKDLVRVKGYGGLTPLHFASRNGDVELLANFLFACPDSIEDLTVKGETALHIAVKNNNYEALDLLVCFLRRFIKRGARNFDCKILNRKDEADNTVLHILAQRNFEPQVAHTLELLLKTRINLNAKNLEDKTALDMVFNEDIRGKLLSVGAKPGLLVHAAPTLAHKLILVSNITIFDKLIIFSSSLRRDISEEQRNTWLIIATLVATSVYQAALSPPGGVYQANASDTNVNITSSNSTVCNMGNAGKSVMSNFYFLMFSITNILSFLVSVIAIIILTPSGVLSALVSVPLILFSMSYLVSMRYLSPGSNVNIVDITNLSIGFVCSIYLVIRYYNVIIRRWAMLRSKL